MSAVTLRAPVEQRPAALLEARFRQPPQKLPGHEHRLRVKLTAEEAAFLDWYRGLAFSTRRRTAGRLMCLMGAETGA